jgi:hypothetical protein
MLPIAEHLSHAAITVNLVIATGVNAEGQLEARKLSLSQELAADFLEIAKAYIQNLHNKQATPYQPELEPKDNRYLHLEIASSNIIRALLEQATDLPNLQMYEADEPKFIKRLSFYALVISHEQHKMVLLREFKASRVLSFGKGLTAVFARASGTFQKLEDSLFRFDDNIDCMAYDSQLLITNPGAFMRIFNYYQHITEKAQVALESIASQIPIVNFTEFQQACLADKRMQQKLASIAGQDYFQALDFGKVREVIDRHELEVPVIEDAGEEKLQFSADIRHRWTILKLLDDDYLESPMTDLSYEANSKVRITRKKLE